MTDRPRLYRALYSPGTAAALVLAAGVLLATSQTRVIVDAVAIVHPKWWAGWYWTTAIGFETAILAVGLVMAMTGDRTLWRWEVVLVVVSVVAGVAAAMVGHQVGDRAAWVHAVAIGLMPIQYLAVVLTGHRLAEHGRSDVATVTDDRAADHATTAPATDAETTVIEPPTTAPPATAKTATMTADPAVAAAIADGVARTTARRWSTAGDPRLDRYRPKATANGHAPPS